MSVSSKSIVILSVVICAVFTVLVVAYVLGAVRQRGLDSDEGFFSPVYSPDGQYVYFIQRNTSGTVVVTKPADLLFSPAELDVSVAKDSFVLKRMHVENGQTEELRRLPPSPTEGGRFQMLGTPFHYAGIRLRFKEDQQLEYKVCLTIHQGSSVKEYMSSGPWNNATAGADNADVWKPAACMIQGYDEWPLFGDWELQEVHRPGFFPVAIVAYNHVTQEVRTLIKNKHYDQLFPKGVPLQQLAKNSRRTGIERDQTVRRVYKELVDKYKAMGMSEVPAALRAGKDMQQLGYFPKTTMLVARRLTPADTRSINKDALFKVPKGEMDSGVFHDIEEAIARPGEEVDKGGEYHIHRDYSNSARLNKFLQAGNTRFYIEYLGQTYELTIKRP